MVYLNAAQVQVLYCDLFLFGFDKRWKGTFK